MSVDRMNPEELALKYGVGLDHHSKLGEPLASQLAAPSCSPGFRRIDWLRWFVDFARSGSLGARVTPEGEFVPDWYAKDSIVVQQSLTALAEVDLAQPCLLVHRPYVKARLTGFVDGDETLVEEFGRSDTDIRDEVHLLVVPYKTGVEKYARLVEQETWRLARQRGRVVACDRCVSPGPFEHVDSDHRRPAPHDAPLFVVSVGMVHISLALCSRHAAILRQEAEEVGVKLTEVPPLSELDDE